MSSAYKSLQKKNLFHLRTPLTTTCFIFPVLSFSSVRAQNYTLSCHNCSSQHTNTPPNQTHIHTIENQIALFYLPVSNRNLDLWHPTT
eukprot:m.141501 g.141501  ORF g.141501 m.141501 type:complete len:88 (-) comp14037_c1_seq16:769-1032(-)